MRKNFLVSFLAFLLMYYSLGFIQDARSDNHGGLTDILLGSAPNFIASLFLPLFFSFARGKSNLYQASLAISLGLIVYEIIQLFIDERVFDYFDIIFSVLGFFASVIFIRAIFPKENIYKILDLK